MTRLINNFEGGPDGTTLTVANSDQSGTQDAFDALDSSGTGNVLKFMSAVNLARPTAEYVLHIATGSTINVYPDVRWEASMGAQSQIWTRFYVYLTSVSANVRDLNLFSAWTSATSNGVGVYIQNSGSPLSFAILNFKTSAISYMPTVITAGTWHRVEFRATMSATVGSADLTYYSGDNVDTTTPTDTVSITGQNFGASTANRFALGPDWSYQANTPDTYLSSWELNNTGYPGPAPFRAGKGVPGVLTNPMAIHSDIS
jgi:hypothetical protein